MHWLNVRNCRRRKIQTLCLLLLIILIYFLLQFFSLSRLGSASQRGLKLHMQAKKMDMVKNQGGEMNNGDTWREEKEVPRGVLPSDASQYAKHTSGWFKCLNSELQIPAERVNDNYCDCPDSTDEPGTSACPQGRFYCRKQLPHQDAQFVHSSKVNDGICDCCDGSDEWKGRQVPAPMQLHGRSGAVFHTPCLDRCGDLLQLMEHEEKIRRQGVILQKRYIDAARSLSPRHQNKFGPLGIFYLLSKECYQHAAHEYLYTVCPFESVQQSRGTMSKAVLGRQGQWSQLKPGDYILDMTGGDAFLCPDGKPRETKLKPGDYILDMTGGDAFLCPDGKPRETKIRFLCGLEDRVISVTEDQKCRYIVRFSSPAAC